MSACRAVAQEEFLKFLVFRCAFPRDLDTQIIGAWARATAKTQGDQNLCQPDIIHLRHIFRKLHLSIRTELRPMIIPSYNLKYGANTQVYNQDIQLCLLRKIAFTFKDPIKRRRVYRNPLISKAVTAILDLMADIDCNDELSDGVPLPTIAFAISVIEQALEEWHTGKFVQRREICTTAHHCLRFSQHLRTLQAIDVRAQKKLRARLFVEARYDILLTMRDLACAAKEAEEDELEEDNDDERNSRELALNSGRILGDGEWRFHLRPRTKF
ncbi:hypothetical protein VKT23_004611 [Stygiomarasmius scandens]|uniref:DUF6532 domain-containing protein n=1 Tax=Marasmiellus scandens TaxID=2682957 RepID=A0ABR1JWI1_9AGAR